MGRAPCCDKGNVKRGPWSPEEDAKLKEFMEKHGTGGNWIALPQKAGLRRCGKSCRLRWLNYLRPNLKHGEFSDDEDRLICTLFACIGSRWSIIAAQLPGRTDNDIKNYWNTKLKKKLINMVHPPQTKPHSHRPTNSSFLQTSSPPSPSPSLSSFLSSPNSTTAAAILQPDQESFVGPMQHQVKESLLMFGGDQASCSSSDGSFNNQIRHGKDYEYGEQPVLQNYLYNGVEENQKFMLSNGGSGVTGWTGKQNVMWGESTALDYGGLEEIKQLISTNSCNNFLFDENKTEERVMYY